MGKYGKGLYGNVLRDFLSNSYKKTNQSKSLDGYQRDDSLSGQRTQVYHNNDTNKTIVTHRGTSGLQDWITETGFEIGCRVEITFLRFNLFCKGY